MRSRFHRDRSWSASRTSDPSDEVRAGRRDSVRRHNAQETFGLRLVGHQFDEDACEANRFFAQLLTDERISARGGIALVEDEVDDREHRAKAVGELGVAGHPIGDVGVADLVLGSHEPLRHRGFFDEERPGDLRGLQPRDQPQRQRHPCVRSERGMATGEDQAQPVVVHGPPIDWFVCGMEQRGLFLAVIS